MDHFMKKVTNIITILFESPKISIEAQVLTSITIS